LKISARIGALVAEGQVILDGATLVAVPLNREMNAGMLLQEFDIGLHRTLLVGANIGFVIVEVDVLPDGGKGMLTVTRTVAVRVPPVL